jgi:hypothetical protein
MTVKENVHASPPIKQCVTACARLETRHPPKISFLEPSIVPFDTKWKVWANPERSVPFFDWMKNQTEVVNCEIEAHWSHKSGTKRLPGRYFIYGLSFCTLL